MTSWGPTTFTVGSALNTFPSYQWKGANNPTTVRFTLSSSQVAAHTVRGIRYDKDNWQVLLIATLVLGLLNAFLRPLLMLLSLPLLIVSLGLFTLVVTAYLFFRPARPAGRLGQQDAERVRELLRKQGDRDSLGYFTLRSDKSIIWSPTCKSCIGYRVVSGVMLAGGDPLGDPEAWPGAIHAFLDEAARHAWVPAVMGCGELAAEVWCREGELTALELGDEFGLVTYADEPKSWLRAGSGQFQFHRLRDRLMNLESLPTTPDYEALFGEIRLRLRRRAFLVLLADLAERSFSE